jgi:glycosyltransferase involved in cell wall biosynthesis
MRVTMMVRCLAMMRGGGETRHLAWVRELRSLGVDVEVIAGEPLILGAAKHPVTDVPATTLRTPYLRDAVYRWQNRRGFGRATMAALHLDDEWFCRAAWRHIASQRPLPDVVHAHAVHQAARLRRADLPVVINLPGAPHARYTDDLRAADALIADGWAAERLPDLLGCTVTHVPKGVDAALFTPEGESRRTALGLSDRRVVIAVGRFVPIKNMALLVEAMRAVVDRVPDAHLLLAGEGPERASLDALAARLGIERHVTFTGYVPLEELPAFYRSADVFALTSNFDNSPNVVLEAMACELPVVATDVGGVKGFVAEPGGTLVPAGDAARLADAIVAWLESAGRREAAGSCNRRLVLERYSWRASARRLLEVYERVATRARPRERRSA